MPDSCATPITEGPGPVTLDPSQRTLGKRLPLPDSKLSPKPKPSGSGDLGQTQVTRSPPHPPRVGLWPSALREAIPSSHTGLRGTEEACGHLRRQSASLGCAGPAGTVPLAAVLLGDDAEGRLCVRKTPGAMG